MLDTEQEMKITVVIPLCEKDFLLTVHLLEWLQALKGTQKLDYDCVFVFHFFGFKQMNYLGFLGRDVFRHCHFIIPASGPKRDGWPHGPNYLFQETLNSMNEPFLWLEPDCIPLCPEWLDSLNEEYFRMQMPFMGTINSDQNKSHFSGVAVYPKDARHWYKNKFPTEVAFDMVPQDEIMANCHDTNLIHNFWGKKGLPPTFKENLEKSDPENTLTPDAIKKTAVLFHRCKDGSLSKILRKRINESATK